MAIDYQQILMEMNRPRRRQGGAWKKLLVTFLILAILGGGGYAVWHFELVDKAWNAGQSLVERVRNRNRDDGAESAESAELAMAGSQADGAAQIPAQNQPESAMPMRPPAAAPLPANTPVDLARDASAAPRLAVPTTATALAASPSPSPAPLRPASAQPAAPVAPVKTPGHAAVDASVSPSPVLSDAKAQIRVVDQLLRTDPAEAMRRVESLLGMRLDADEAAEVGYRRGYAARLLRDEALAESSWKETAEKYPRQLGGRFAALALADTWYQHYAAERPQLSYWDDIQLLYSRALGADDAPFLPEAMKREVKSKLTRLNDSLFFGTAPSKMARYHKVETGELLGSIARQYRVDYESIARINGINPNHIRVGMDLKLVVGEVSVVVRKNERDPEKGPTLTWFLDDRWVREYPACVGQGVKTPAGTYSFTSKERDPSWTNPANGQLLPNNHPENILGSRWMAMKGMNTQGLGIHGTTVDDSIPGYTSAGCVRLHNRDVEELFSYARIGGKVTILE